MLNDIILCIARLTDPFKSSGRENLSFDSILAEIDDSSVRIEASEIISKIKTKTKAIRVWRNKKLAHNDLKKAVGGNPLPPIYIIELSEMLKLTSQIVNIIYKRFQDTEVRHDLCVTSGDGDSLMFYLEYGLDVWEEDKRNHNVDRLHKLSITSRPKSLSDANRRSRGDETHFKSRFQIFS